MPSKARSILGLCAVLISPLLAAATITGSVYDDTRALAHRADFTPLGGVSLRVYRDGGDGVADGRDDTAAGTAATSANGSYSVEVAGGGLYWVTVDSRTISASSSPNGGSAWAQQTFGSAGAICDNGRGTAIQHGTEGPCYGGRSAVRSDDARSLATAEHVAAAQTGATGSASGIDFAFSFDVVTTVADGDNIQGSLRQFVANANALSGANAMRFVPLEPLPDVQGRQPQHWTITLSKPLPPIRDDGTAINGTAYRFTNATPVVLSRNEMDIRDEAGTRQPEIDLVIVLSGEDGLVVERRGAIRSVELQGAKTAVRTSADLTVERSIIAGDKLVAGTTPATIDAIVATHGLLVLNNTIIEDRARYGITIEGDATLDASDSEVTTCGSPTSGGAIVLRTSGSTVSRSAIHRNGGIGVEVDAPSNTIDSSRISDNWIGIVLRPRASDTTISRNDLIWNRSGAVVGAEANAGPAKHNRITRNHFNENGGETIAIGEIVEDETKRRTPGCDSNKNGTIDPPYVERATKSGDGTIDVEGIACPNATVEIYTSYVTGRLRQRLEQNVRDLYSVREALKRRNVIETRDYEGLNAQRLPSVGEFNYAGVVTADTNGHFRVTVPWPQQSAVSVTSLQNTGGLGVAAIAIDPPGDTSPFSGRKLVGR